MECGMNKNRDNWNDRTPVHEQSEFYDLASFLAGRSSLLSVELDELGDVAGKSMLHLQCHFGQDSLSWARLGARVTGVDFAEEAVKLARSLNDKLGLDARFVCANVYDVPQALPEETFDIVFTSYGVLCWLPDLTRWAEIIYEKLKPGGTFYIAEGHPLADIFEMVDGELRMVYSYFEGEAIVIDIEGTYADRNAKINNSVTYEWAHSLGSIVTALIQAGLRIEFVHEFPFCMYEKFPGLMEKGEDGWWRMKGKEFIPMLFSIRATKPAEA
ncbi:methyltransferase type 12 [Paenibacillus sp. A3]|uniref:class I SAM-dependent methyltransferase n=1 Tax=Paenibacillus sp. A3 TaxID=1337054 RepID=UPI0006D56032|nr:class I SAM-dependent methyltransferase [Paenibacillus sp. A3]KPV59438.1 methyltransferase type 12 [Paenibacillus sp. A3]